MNAQVEEIKQKILPILKEAGVTRSSIFGSYVRGEQREDSDIDILVDYPQSKRLFDFVELQIKLEEALNKKVDLGEYKTLKPRIRDRVLNEQVSIL